MRNRGCWTLLILTFALTACSGLARRESDREALARYMDYAGAPVDHFTNFGRFDGWRPLGRDRLLVWTGINDAYLLRVAPPCMDLEYAMRIGLTSTGSSVSRGFDSVRVGRDRCRITEIRPVDYKQLKEDMRAGM